MSPASSAAPQSLSVRRVARLATIPLAALYTIALLAFPSDFGPRVLGFVWSPSRVVLVLLLLAAVASGGLDLRRLRREPRWLLAAWAIFLGAAATTALLFPGPGVTARFLSLGIEGTVLYWVVRSVIDDGRLGRRIILAAIAVTAFVAVFSLALSLAGFRYDALLPTLAGQQVPPNISGDRFGFVRQQGSFPAALFLGIWIASSSVLVLPWTESLSRRSRLLATITWWVLLAGVAFLTVSRVAVTGMLLIAGCYLLLRHRRAVGLVAVGAAIIVGLGFAGLSMGSPAPSPAATPSAQPNTTARPGESQPSPAAGPPTEVDLLAGSNELRIQALRATVRAVAERPLFGWGLLRAKDVVTSVGGSTNYVDSSVLAIVVETGLIGLAALLAVALAALARGRGAQRTAEGLATYLAVLSIGAMSVVAAYLVVTQGYASFWLLAGLLPAFKPGGSSGFAAPAPGAPNH